MWASSWWKNRYQSGAISVYVSSWCLKTFWMRSRCQTILHHSVASRLPSLLVLLGYACPATDHWKKVDFGTFVKVEAWIQPHKNMLWEVSLPQILLPIHLLISDRIAIALHIPYNSNKYERDLLLVYFKYEQVAICSILDLNTVSPAGRRSVHRSQPKCDVRKVCSHNHMYALMPNSR